jgi:hypothetical protein
VAFGDLSPIGTSLSFPSQPQPAETPDTGFRESTTIANPRQEIRKCTLREARLSTGQTAACAPPTASFAIQPEYSQRIRLLQTNFHGDIPEGLDEVIRVAKADNGLRHEPQRRRLPHPSAFERFDNIS